MREGGSTRVETERLYRGVICWRNRGRAVVVVRERKGDTRDGFYLGHGDRARDTTGAVLGGKRMVGRPSLGSTPEGTSDEENLIGELNNS